MNSKKWVILAWLLFLAYVLMAMPPIEEGKSIFMTRCAACHNVNKTLTGPALAGIDKKRSFEWLVSFIHSSQTMVKQGDKDAVAVFEQFNKVPMPDHTDLTEAQIKDILAYIAAEEQAPGVVQKYVPGKKIKPYLPLSFQHYPWILSFMVIVVLLVLTLFGFVSAMDYKRQRRENAVPS